jgi:hypothetical protein
VSDHFFAVYGDDWRSHLTPSGFISMHQIIHHIWLGGPLPPQYRSFVDSWKLHHSTSQGWQHVLWTDEAIEVALTSSSSSSSKKIKEDATAAAVAAPNKETTTTSTYSSSSSSLFDPLTCGLKISNKEALESAPNFGEKSDILRYEILKQVLLLLLQLIFFI